MTSPGINFYLPTSVRNTHFISFNYLRAKSVLCWLSFLAKVWVYIIYLSNPSVPLYGTFHQRVNILFYHLNRLTVIWKRNGTTLLLEQFCIFHLVIGKMNIFKRKRNIYMDLPSGWSWFILYSSGKNVLVEIPEFTQGTPTTSRNCQF